MLILLLMVAAVTMASDPIYDREKTHQGPLF